MMKKCCYCHKDLQGVVGITCEKCKANEAKYGKPGVCKYCQLPAAFLDEKCVHCSYAERKHGQPVACSKCQLKCAFPKSPSLKNKPILCRLCMLAHGPATSASAVNSTALKSAKRRPSISTTRNLSDKSSLALAGGGVGSESNKMVPTLPDSPFASASSSATPLIGGTSTTKKSRRDSFEQHVDAGAEHIFTIQQLKDNILELTRTIYLRDKLIQEKDQKIAELNADLLRRDRTYREKIVAMEKGHNDMVGPLRDQIKNLTRQVSQLQKHNKSTIPPNPPPSV